MSAVEKYADLRVDTLSIPDRIGFNDWKRLGDLLFENHSRMQWHIGDWWLWGQRFAGGYREGLDQIAHTHGTVVEYARVARVFPPRRTGDPHARISEVSFSHHAVAASVVDPDERIAWLEDALRHGWSTRQLAREIQEEYGKPATRPRLTVARSQELYELCSRAASVVGEEPGVWAANVLERAAREALALEAA